MAACRRDAFMSGRLTSLDGTPLRGESGPGGECGATPKEGATSGPHDAKRSTLTVLLRACVRAVPCRPHVRRRVEPDGRDGRDGIADPIGYGREGVAGLGPRNSPVLKLYVTQTRVPALRSQRSLAARTAGPLTAPRGKAKGVQGQLSEASNVGRGRSRASLSSSSYVRFHE